jgi:hypothetical protein
MSPARSHVTLNDELLMWDDRRRGCRQVLLMTFTIHAPAFYATHGFEVIAVVDDDPRGHKHLLLRKRLGESG